MANRLRQTMRFFLWIGLLLAMKASAAANELFSIQEQAAIHHYLLNNIASSDHVFIKKEGGSAIHSIPGAVFASPSNKQPGFTQDYQFHWVRDAAITMNQLITEYRLSQAEMRQRYYATLKNYALFEKRAQQASSAAGDETLGQPKYNIDGKVWEGQWARPQNDGPALRALTLLRLVSEVFTEEDKVISPAMIYLDLDYVVAHWQRSSYDLWEEVNDKHHFFNKMVQRKALAMGAIYATQHGDRQRASHYRVTADAITQSLMAHWYPARGYLAETLKQQDYKGGGLNSAIILGVLYGNLHDTKDAFAVTSHQVESTVFYLRNIFSALYPINFKQPGAVPLIGRYPLDIYDGDHANVGHPWVLLTNVLAHYYYECAIEYQQRGVIEIDDDNFMFFKQLSTPLSLTKQRIDQHQQKQLFQQILQALVTEGDKLLLRVKSYGACEKSRCLHYAEQLHRVSGKPLSASDLTWNYSSLLQALSARAAFYHG